MFLQPPRSNVDTPRARAARLGPANVENPDDQIGPRNIHTKVVKFKTFFSQHWKKGIAFFICFSQHWKKKASKKNEKNVLICTGTANKRLTFRLLSKS